MTQSGGSGGRIQWKRSENPLHSVVASTGFCDRFHWKSHRFHCTRWSLPLDPATASEGNLIASAVFDGRFHWNCDRFRWKSHRFHCIRWSLPLDPATASTGFWRRMNRNPWRVPRPIGSRGRRARAVKPPAVPGQPDAVAGAAESAQSPLEWMGRNLQLRLHRRNRPGHPVARRGSGAAVSQSSAQASPRNRPLRIQRGADSTLLAGTTFKGERVPAATIPRERGRRGTS